MASLNQDNVPPALRALLPLAEEWGISDDVVRSARLKSAKISELELLVEAVDSVDDTLLYEWLADPKSYEPEPSDEYVAITCLTMAADAARLRLSGKRK